jgi:Tfp pilus assembly protein PilX
MHNYYLPRQAGSALVLTLIMVFAVVAMLSLGSERMFAARVNTQMSADHSRALSAAETLSGLIEAKLFQLASEPKKLSEDLERSTWWDLRGSEMINGKINTALYLDGCALRWRIEPVKIMSKTLSDNTTSSDNDKFTVNSQIDPNLQIERRDDAGRGLYDQDPGYYHFRIVTEAYALKDPSAVSTIPWDTPGTYTTSAQAQRILQLKNVSLFKYVIFYAATGPTGDIEFHNGPPLDIQGAVHSNGALYFGGAGNGYLTGSYHGSASDAGMITIGQPKPTNPSDKTDPTVSITGVDGIFRLRKQANLRMAAVTPDFTLFNPYMVPMTNKKTVAGVSMFGDKDLNGDTPDDTRVKLNGIKLVSVNDSRNGLVGPDGEKHTDKVTDGKNRKAQTVKSLSEFSSFAGYPLEFRKDLGPGLRLLKDANNNYTWQSAVGTTPVAGGLFASELPLFYFSGKSQSDIWPQQPTGAGLLNYPATIDPVLSVSGLDTTTPGWPILNVKDVITNTYLPTPPNFDRRNIPYPDLPDYFTWSILGKKPNAVTGLTIRERGMQNQQWLVIANLPITYPQSSWKDAPTLTQLGNDPTAFVDAYAAWMKSNYVVYLGKDMTAGGVPIDITDTFFNYRLFPSTGKLTDLPAYEQDKILADVRARRWESGNGYLPGNVSNSNVLTLNVGLIMDYLRLKDLKDIEPTKYAGSAPGIKANSVFNGLLYVHRSHRYDTHVGTNRPFAHPLKTCGYHPIAPINRPPGYPVVKQYPETGMVGMAPTNLTVGTPGSWAMYHSTRSVRLANASEINHGGLQASFNDRRSGLTVVTPNHCYLQGNYNTVIPSDGKITPCAVFADGLTSLSDAWVDSTPDAKPRPFASSTVLNTCIVINNLPSDAQNISDAGSGGLHNVIRLLEDWQTKGATWTFRGSLVVINRMRYSRATLQQGSSYIAPLRFYDFNEDLLVSSGQPPFSPMGTVPTRVISTVNLLNQ